MSSQDWWSQAVSDWLNTAAAAALLLLPLYSFVGSVFAADASGKAATVLPLLQWCWPLTVTRAGQSQRPRRLLSRRPLLAELLMPLLTPLLSCELQEPARAEREEKSPPAAADDVGSVILWSRGSVAAECR